MRKTIYAAAVTAALALGAPAGASTLVSWGTTGTFSLTPSASFGDLKVRAYSTSSTPATSGQRGATDGSSWLAAQLQGYGTSGFGVRNGCGTSGAAGCAGVDTNEGTTPEHAVDNEQLVDVVVFELPILSSVTWSFSALSIGYTANDGSPEVNVWVGGKSLGAGYDFSNTCFQSCTTGGELSITQRGFTYAGRVDFNTGSNGTNGAVINAFDTGSPLFDNRDAGATGQYIVIAASSTANGLWDAFKISGLKAWKTDVVEEPPPSVPEPGSLALIAGGLLGFAWLRRRRAA